MKAIEAIMTRRSIRKFNEKAVSDEEINLILRAAMAAPSAGNQQPWHFVVIRDRIILDDIPSVHPFAQMLRQVSVAICVCGDLTREKFKGFWVQDCSAATENMLLAAHAMGLASVWLGVHPVMAREAGVRKLLKLPEHVIPLSILPLGYPDESLPQVDRYNMHLIHKDTW